MRICLLVLLLRLPASLIRAAPCGGHGDRNTLLVSSAWPAEHANDPGLTVPAVGQKSDYDQAHIPGSVFLDYMEIHGNGPLTLEIPPMDQIAAVFGKLGIGNQSRIVIYNLRAMDASSARAYVTLDAAGLGAQTSILDGGLPNWRAENRPVTDAVPAVKPGAISPCPQNDVIASLDDVRSNLHHAGVDIVDARTAASYTGQSFTDGRAGRIPGAININFGTMLDAKGKLKPAGELQQQFQAEGVKGGDRIVTYCHIGQQAGLIYFVSRYLGYDARLYDGSWEEWARHPELPVETPQSRQ